MTETCIHCGQPETFIGYGPPSSEKPEEMVPVYRCKSGACPRSKMARGEVDRDNHN